LSRDADDVARAEFDTDGLTLLTESSSHDVLPRERV
jgi:hypothetical protein